MSGAASQSAASRPRRVDVLLPVRADASAARRCVASVLAAAGETPFDVVVVAFAAAAGAIDDALRELARDQRVVVIRARSGAEDRQALDRAFALHRDRDVVLLDIECEVHGNWLDRLAAHAQGEGIGAVVPFANAGGGATYPRMGDANDLPGGESVASLDAIFAKVNAGRAADVDAALGACRYVTRAAIEAVGLPLMPGGDDANVARDWSRRAANAGLRFAIAGDVFVGTGAVDAGAGHDRNSVRDALALARRIDLARLAASPRPAVVFVAHAWGGGIRRYMNDVARFAGDRANILYLEPAGADAVKLHWPRAREGFAAWFRLPSELPQLAQMLRAIGVSRLHFHHVHGLPQSILDLPRATGVAYDVTLHDYYAICPQYHLVDRHGRYCGEPDAAGCAACLAARPAQWPLDIAAWRARFGGFLHGAARVIAPSHDVEARMRRYFAALPIVVWPHPEVSVSMPPPPIRVVTLGNLSPEKGLRVVAECARDAKQRMLPLAFRVLGAIAEPIARWPDVPLTIHGSYVDDELPALLAAERADVLFFPAQVPETYAYTLSAALATDTAIVASAIGALPERLAGRARVRLLAFDAPASAWNDAMLDVAREAPARASSGVATGAAVAAGS